MSHTHPRWWCDGSDARIKVVAGRNRCCREEILLGASRVRIGIWEPVSVTPHHCPDLVAQVFHTVRLNLLPTKRLIYVVVSARSENGRGTVQHSKDAKGRN